MKSILFSFLVLATGSAEAASVQCPVGSHALLACEVNGGYSISVCGGLGAINAQSNLKLKVERVVEIGTVGQLEVTRLITNGGNIDIKTFKVPPGGRLSKTPAEVIFPGSSSKSARCDIWKFDVSRASSELR